MSSQSPDRGPSYSWSCRCWDRGKFFQLRRIVHRKSIQLAAPVNSSSIWSSGWLSCEWNLTSRSRSRGFCKTVIVSRYGIRPSFLRFSAFLPCAAWVLGYTGYTVRVLVWWKSLWGKFTFASLRASRSSPMLFVRVFSKDADPSSLYSFSLNLVTASSSTWIL